MTMIGNRPSQPKPRIYITIELGGSPIFPHDILGIAKNEDGEVIAQHISSSRGWVAYDMGLTSDRHHDKYRELYPDGYELVDRT